MSTVRRQGRQSAFHFCAISIFSARFSGQVTPTSYWTDDRRGRFLFQQILQILRIEIFLNSSSLLQKSSDGKKVSYCNNLTTSANSANCVDPQIEIEPLLKPNFYNNKKFHGTKQQKYSLYPKEMIEAYLSMSLFGDKKPDLMLLLSL